RRTMRGTRTWKVVPAVMATVLGLARDSGAQLKGHYIPGFTGLSNGSQAPPGINILPLYFCTTDTLKDDNGDTLANARVNASFLGPGVAWVTNVKLLGGNWGGQVLPIAFMKSRIEGNSLDVPGLVPVHRHLRAALAAGPRQARIGLQGRAAITA